MVDVQRFPHLLDRYYGLEEEGGKVGNMGDGQGDGELQAIWGRPTTFNVERGPTTHYTNCIPLTYLHDSQC